MIKDLVHEEPFKLSSRTPLGILLTSCPGLMFVPFFIRYYTNKNRKLLYNLFYNYRRRFSNIYFLIVFFEVIISKITKYKYCKLIRI